MSHGHRGTCQEAQNDLSILLRFVGDIATSETVEDNRMAARRCLASVGARRPRHQLPKDADTELAVARLNFPSAECAYCGQPMNSSACQKSHP